MYEIVTMFINVNYYHRKQKTICMKKLIYINHINLMYKGNLNDWYISNYLQLY